MMYKDFCKRYFPRIFKAAKTIKGKIKQKTDKEKKKSFGKLNPNKTFYVIRSNDSRTGLMCYYNSALGYIAYALDKEWYPVVDMQNYPNTYLEDSYLHKKNSWEYYFKQPMDVSLEEVYKSKNVILSPFKHSREATPIYLYQKIYSDSEMSKKYFDIIQRFITLNEDMCAEIKDQYSQIFPIGKKIVGVVCRGTDLLNYKHHSRQPSIKELIDVVSSIKKKYCCDYIFLASDEEKNIITFKKFFGTKFVLYNECLRFDSYVNKNEKVLGDIKFARPNDAYLRGREYLTTVALLAKCDCLVGTLVGATVGAIGFNAGKYEHIEIIDLGVY